jgi:hypothetical protein
MSANLRLDYPVIPRQTGKWHVCWIAIEPGRTVIGPRFGEYPIAAFDQKSDADEWVSRHPELKAHGTIELLNLH